MITGLVCIMSGMITGLEYHILNEMKRTAPIPSLFFSSFYREALGINSLFFLSTVYNGRSYGLLRKRDIVRFTHDTRYESKKNIGKEDITL